jgi:drug/metabolite transporter (DMT)-like permease
LSLFLDTISKNPVAYLLAFMAAILWSLYCVLTRKLAQGHNGVPLFFVLRLSHCGFCFYDTSVVANAFFKAVASHHCHGDFNWDCL